MTRAISMTTSSGSNNRIGNMPILPHYTLTKDTDALKQSLVNFGEGILDDVINALPINTVIKTGLTMADNWLATSINNSLIKVGIKFSSVNLLSTYGSCLAIINGGIEVSRDDKKRAESILMDKKLLSNALTLLTERNKGTNDPFTAVMTPIALGILIAVQQYQHKENDI